MAEMNEYDETLKDLAREITSHLGSQDDADITFVADWLVNGGDDGRTAQLLANAFKLNNQLPSRAQKGQ